MVSFQCASWNDVKSFFSKGGDLSRMLKTKFQTATTDTETVIWLDGGNSTEIAYALRRNSNIVATDDGQRRAVCDRLIKDIVCVWSPL